MEKIISNVPLCVLLCTATAYREQSNMQLTVEIVVYLLGYISAPKKITEDILHKVYIEKGAIIGIWLVLPLWKWEVYR